MNRANIHQCLLAHVPHLDPEILRKLERELLIVISSPSAEERDQRIISQTIGELQKRLDTKPYPDAVQEMNRLLDDATGVPYLFQKMVQNIAARIYRQGLIDGSQK